MRNVTHTRPVGTGQHCDLPACVVCPQDRRIRPAPPRSRWLGPLNFAVIQWFGVPLQRSMAWRDGRWHHVRWSLRRWVLPLTGWWSRYIETRGAR